MPISCCSRNQLTSSFSTLLLAVLLLLLCCTASARTPWASSNVLHTWSDFGISYRHFTGKVGNASFQARVWVRMICRSQHIEARMVTAWHGIPAWIPGVHAATEASLLTGDQMPRMWFEGLTQQGQQDLRDVEQWVDAHAIRGGYSAAHMASAQLAYNQSYSLSIHGADEVHEFLPDSCTSTHSLFVGHQPVWVVASNHPYHRQHIPPRFAWLVGQHAQHHRCLGLNGLILVTSPRKAHHLLHHTDSAEAIRNGSLVVIMWDSGFIPEKHVYYQMPVHNIMRLASWDSDALLGMWDIDEFLVLPRNKTIQDQLGQGCLGQVLAQNQEVTFNMSWMVLPGARASDLRLWADYPSWPAAMQRLPYQQIPYRNCMNACKSMIVPWIPANFLIHGTIRMNFAATTVPVECGRILHFSAMWGRRSHSHNQGEPVPFDKDTVLPEGRCSRP